MLKKKLLCAVVGLLMASTMVFADDLNDADKAFTQGDNLKAAQLYEKACNGGIQLGCDELKKSNTPISEDTQQKKEERMKSLNIDFDKLQKVTDKYSSEANKQYVLGSRYRYGLELEKDYKKAITWLEKVANLEITLEDDVVNGKFDELNTLKAVAQNNLGNLYYNGHGVKQDKNKAKELYEKACNGGNFISCESLKDLK